MTPAPKVHRYVHPLSKALVIEIGLGSVRTSFGGPSRPGQVELWSKSRTKMRADAFIDTEPWVAGTFVGRSMSESTLLRTPGSMLEAITVGSYDFNAIDDRTETPRVLNDRPNFPGGKPLRLGDLSAYSSPGPNRGGVVKPLVAAPGQFHIAAEAGSSLGQGYRLFNGTSAATPYAAGIVALLMQKKPDLTFGEIKSLLRKHVSKDDVTGRTPNPQWGYGRLDYRAVQAMIKALQ
jgi:hypothetical protein